MITRIHFKFNTCVYKCFIKTKGYIVGYILYHIYYIAGYNDYTETINYFESFTAL